MSDIPFWIVIIVSVVMSTVSYLMGIESGKIIEKGDNKFSRDDIEYAVDKGVRMTIERLKVNGGKNNECK
jgi:hypothetical protein